MLGLSALKADIPSADSLIQAQKRIDNAREALAKANETLEEAYLIIGQYKRGLYIHQMLQNEAQTTQTQTTQAQNTDSMTGGNDNDEEIIVYETGGNN